MSAHLERCAGVPRVRRRRRGDHARASLDAARAAAAPRAARAAAPRGAARSAAAPGRRRRGARRLAAGLGSLYGALRAAASPHRSGIASSCDAPMVDDATRRARCASIRLAEPDRRRARCRSARRKPPLPSLGLAQQLQSTLGDARRTASPRTSEALDHAARVAAALERSPARRGGSPAPCAPIDWRRFAGAFAPGAITRKRLSRRPMPDQTSTNGAHGGSVGKVIEIKGVVIDAAFTGSPARDLQRARDRDPGRRRRRGAHARGRGAGSTSATTACARSRWTRPTGSRAGSTSSTPAQPISVPVGDATLGRIWNVLGEPVDKKPPAGDGRRALVDPPRAAGVPRPLADRRDLRDRDQGDRPDRAVRQGRQDRPLRRRRRRQDGADPGADPQHRQAARRRLGLRRRRRAHARGQRPDARDDRVGRDRQGRARLRADERAAGRAPARRALRA